MRKDNGFGQDTAVSTPRTAALAQWFKPIRLSCVDVVAQRQLDLPRQRSERKAH
jgi:hypothetical protein